MHLVEKWVKCSHLLFIIFSLSNCNYSSIVQCLIYFVQCLNHDAAFIRRIQISQNLRSSIGSFYIPCIIMVILYSRIFKVTNIQELKSWRSSCHLVKLCKDAFQRQQALYDRAARARVQENPPGANPGPNISCKSPGLA